MESRTIESIAEEYASDDMIKFVELKKQRERILECLDSKLKDFYPNGLTKTQEDVFCVDFSMHLWNLQTIKD